MESWRRMSIIAVGGLTQVAMAHLATVGSHSVNGVAKLHSDLLKRNLLSDFSELWPKRFNNKTNGVTHRRWLLYSNPELSELITSCIGDGWISDLREIRAVEDHVESQDFRQKFTAAKNANNHLLASLILRMTGIQIAPDSLVDVQVKRIHEYKRQLLNVMHIIHRYLEIVVDGQVPSSPRTFII